MGNESFKKPQKLPKSPANGLSASRSFSLVGSSDCEEFRSGQKLQNSHFESAAYANFATPAAFTFNSLPKAFRNPMNLSPICRLRRLASLIVLPSLLDARPVYFASRDSVQSGRCASPISVRSNHGEQQVMGNTFCTAHSAFARQEWPWSSSSILACSASASNSAICRRISALSLQRLSRLDRTGSSTSSNKRSFQSTATYLDHHTG